MKRNRWLTVAFAAAGLMVAGSATGQEHAAHEKNLVEVAVEAGSFTTLVRAVEAAGLVEVLQGEGPFTVFAPTDEAFAALPAGVLEGLLEDREKLAAVLTYHVVAGRLTAADVVRGGSSRPESVQGQRLTVTVTDGKVQVDGANVVATDVMASNGVIHVIDRVILPAESMSSASR
jgi:uncharacterized surface protein with fasciclin (FAS1) repeats